MVTLPILILSLAAANVTRAQGPTRQTPKGVVIESNRKELDMLLLRKPIPATGDNPVRQALLKQINEDFRHLQILNNELMSKVWPAPAAGDSEPQPRGHR